MGLSLRPAEIEQAFREMYAYFSQPGAVIARDKLTGDCVYFSKDGHKCAIGCRIPAEWMETRGIEKVNEAGAIYGLTDAFPEVGGIIGECGSDLWNFHDAAQGCHDYSSSVEEFLTKLQGVAIAHGVIPQRVKEIIQAEDAVRREKLRTTEPERQYAQV